MTATRERRSVAPTDLLLFAVVTWVPLLLGARSRVNADTKAYLYLDPGELLDRARSLWDPTVGGGIVTHQTIGYLWPMGPFYALTNALRVPDWVAQRMWVGGIQFAAATGALLLLRHLLPRHPGQLVGALLYGLSPFVLGHVTGQSALLLPFGALPWLVWCVVRAIDEGGWRWPAAFALIVTSCGSLNGSSLFFVLCGATLWIPYAIWWSREADARRGLTVLAHIAVLTLVTQVWWLAAYSVGGRYGLPILSVTETMRGTSNTTSAAEILRGLGYWFEYGRDTHEAWLAGIIPRYLESPFFIAVSFALPVAALALGSVVRWGPRAYFAALIAIGTVMAVGAFPSPQSPAGNLFEALSRRSDLVLSLRNTQRAAPLVVLGLAGLVAAGLTAISRDHVRIGVVSSLAMLVLVAGAMPSQWRSGLIAERFHYRQVPAPWRAAASYLDTRSGRVLELPGIDFASYRWGHTLDPVSVGLADRPVLARELVPMGGRAGISLLNALDRSIQEGWFEPASIVPVARLLGATDVLARNDLEYERYRTVRPERFWAWLTDPAARLETPTAFGIGVANHADPSNPMLDEIELGLHPAATSPPELAVFAVPGAPRAMLTAYPAGSAVVVDGDGEGVLAVAAAGLLDGRPGPLLLAADVTRIPDRFARSTGAGTAYVITDTNRKRAERWYSLRENVGATEPTRARAVLDDPADARLDIVEDMDPSTRSVAEWRGVERVWATSYGGFATLTPEDRPANAFDGDPRTAWRVDTSTTSGTPRIGVDIGREITADLLTLVPPQGRPGTRAVLHARVVLDGARAFDVRATESQARDPDGIRVALDGRPFRSVEVQLLDVGPDDGPAGFAEIAIPDVTVDELVHLPTDVIAQLGNDIDAKPVALVLSRLRADPAEPVRADPETAIRRVLDLHGQLRLSLAGTARLHANGPDDGIDSLVGFADAASGGWTARANEHLPGDMAARAAAAFDGNVATAWSTPFVGVTGQWVEVDAGRTVRLDSLDLDVVADDRHSVPTRLSVSVDDGAPAAVSLPSIDVGAPGTTRRVQVPLPHSLTGRTVRVTIDAIAARTTPDWYTTDPLVMPVALAEIRVPGLPARPAPDAVDTGCRTDLLSVDGRAVAVRVTGSSADALAGRGLAVTMCSPAPLVLGPGQHVVRAAAGLDTGLDLDRVVFTNGAWSQPAAPTVTAPPVTVRSVSATSVSGRVVSDGSPFWLVLDQSMNEGWSLKVDHAHVDGPRPLDSFASGWLVTPERPGTLAVHASWTPQRSVTAALVVSAAAVLLCGVLLVTGGRRRAAGRTTVLPPVVGTTPPNEDRVVTREVAIAIGTGVATALFLHPLAGPVAAVLVVLARRFPRAGRALPAFLVAVSAVQVVYFEARDDYVTQRTWPQFFAGAHVTALLAVILLASTALTERRAPRMPG